MSKFVIELEITEELYNQIQKVLESETENSIFSADNFRLRLQSKSDNRISEIEGDFITLGIVKHQ